MSAPLSPHNGWREPDVAHPGEGCSRTGFSLLELLGVVAIVALLAALVLSAGVGIAQRGRRSRATADLAQLAQALDLYRARFGDYPATGPAPNDPLASPDSYDGPGILYNALTGRRGPSASVCPITAAPTAIVSMLTCQQPEPVADGSGQVANAFVDPWGNRYLYWYRTGGSWIQPAPVLVSAGPDGLTNVPDDLLSWDGAIPTAPENNDNLTAFSAVP
jgi:prepilin-type N-terminal cleavage/methylation domain-containing protein